MLKDCKQQWWKDARYGLFIHWGLYSLLAGEYNGVKTPGIGEWIMKNLQIPVEEYRALAKRFNPTDFDAEKWISFAAKTGMKYLVFTAKHHDGFAMYHSKCSKYNIVDATPFGRDVAAELAQSCKKYGIKFCFYYSQAQDWDEEDAFGYGPKALHERDFDKYLDNKCLPQLRELLTQYGDIGLIWFDTPIIMTYEQSKKVHDCVKSIQPDCIVSGRIGNQLGGYVSAGDNRLPSLPYHGDWEVPCTLNDTWGFKKDDENWKSPADILTLLVKINSRGGNYLLNVGPDARGNIPKASMDILSSVGNWLSKNGESIYATKAAPVPTYENEYGLFTFRDHKLYLHVFNWKNNISLHGHANNFKRMYLLATGEELPFTNSYGETRKIHMMHIDLSGVKQPDPTDSVICMEMEEPEPLYDSLDNL